MQGQNPGLLFKAQSFSSYIQGKRRGIKKRRLRAPAPHDKGGLKINLTGLK